MEHVSTFIMLRHTTTQCVCVCVCVWTIRGVLNCAIISLLGPDCVYDACICVDGKRRRRRRRRRKRDTYFSLLVQSCLSPHEEEEEEEEVDISLFFSLSKITKFKRKRKRNGMNILMQVFQRFLVVVVTLVLLLFLLFFFFEGNRMAISWYGAKKRVIFLTLNSILGGSHTLVRPSVRPSVCVYGPSSESTAHCRVSEWETRKREKEMDEARFDY